MKNTLTTVLENVLPLLVLLAGLFGFAACGLDLGQKDDSMSVEELKFYLLGQMYYERELHCSYYPKDCPSEEEEVIIITQANDPDDEGKEPITDPVDPNKVVAYGFDTNGDGFVDVIAADSDGDGLADKVLYVDDEEKIEPEDEIEVADCQSVTTTIDGEEITAKACGIEIETGSEDEEDSDEDDQTNITKTGGNK